jgi:hypothetical protein
VSLLQVLLADSRKATLLGHPEIAGASVRGQVEEKSNDKKVIIFKMRRRKNAKRLRGFRRQVTMCHNTDIIIYYANTILAAQYLYPSLMSRVNLMPQCFVKLYNTISSLASALSNEKMGMLGYLIQSSYEQHLCVHSTMGTRTTSTAHNLRGSNHALMQ